MGDSWEDWDDDAATIPAPVVPVAAATANKFDDEDIDEDAPKWEGSVPETQAVRGLIFLLNFLVLQTFSVDLVNGMSSYKNILSLFYL